MIEEWAIPCKLRHAIGGFSNSPQKAPNLYLLKKSLGWTKQFLTRYSVNCLSTNVLLMRTIFRMENSTTFMCHSTNYSWLSQVPANSRKFSQNSVQSGITVAKRCDSLKKLTSYAKSVLQNSSSDSIIFPQSIFCEQIPAFASCMSIYIAPFRPTNILDEKQFSDDNVISYHLGKLNSPLSITKLLFFYWDAGKCVLHAANLC